MKTTKFFALALAVLALGACSSDDVIGQKEPAITGGEKGYVSISVNMPTQPTGRAFDETLDDGLPSEYKVNDATLLLFSGATEDGATFASAYNLDATGFAMNGGSTDQITSNATLVQEVTVPTTTNDDNIYALVVLNNNGKITVGAEGALTVGGSNFTGTFKDFYETVLTLSNGADAITGKGIFMSNAPLYSKPGGAYPPTDGTVSTLTVIDKNKIYTTEAEASSNPAANIYVERAVAKVTVNATEGSQTVTDGNENLASYEVAGWTFNVANIKTYPVRNVANGSSWWALKAADQYRFVGNVAVATDLYRTYFGEDPNYSTYSAGDFIIKSGEDLANTTLFGFGANNPGYCLENTFDVANMINNRTTQVVVKAKLTLDSGLAEDDGSFYVLNGNTSTIYKKDGVVATVQGRIADWLQANWDTYFDADGTIQGKAIDVVLSNATTDEGGVITITSATLAQDDLGDLHFKGGQTLEILNADIADQVAALNDEDGLEISYYKGGYAYYPILIKHFGDDQTPWTEETSNTSGAYEGEGADANANWLGRYGVLRNNWYDITVTGIKNIGSPSVPDITGDTDDPESRYIAVSINVLSWTKRTQNADL